MGPKKGNDKQVAAKERKEEDKSAKASKAAKQEEDAYWQSAGDGAKTKSGAKKDEADKKAQEAATKRAEAKRLAEQEEAGLASSSKASASKAAPKPTAKVTQYQLQQQKEFEAKQKEEESKERDMENKREVTEDRYHRLVSSENTNRHVEEASARNVEDALAVLGVADDATGEKHPEKRMKAAWAAYQESQLPELRADKPGLKLQQYKDMIWKCWQKSPENPMNQAAAGPSA